MQTLETGKTIAADMMRIADVTQRLGFGETAEAMRYLAELYAELDHEHRSAMAAVRPGHA